MDAKCACVSVMNSSMAGVIHLFLWWEHTAVMRSFEKSLSTACSVPSASCRSTANRGSFVSAWIGGLTVTATGGYTLIWCIDAVLCVAAAALAFHVRVPDRVHA